MLPQKTTKNINEGWTYCQTNMHNSLGIPIRAVPNNNTLFISQQLHVLQPNLHKTWQCCTALIQLYCLCSAVLSNLRNVKGIQGIQFQSLAQIRRLEEKYIEEHLLAICPAPPLPGRARVHSEATRPNKPLPCNPTPPRLERTPLNIVTVILKSSGKVALTQATLSLWPDEL